MGRPRVSGACPPLRADAMRLRGSASGSACRAPLPARLKRGAVALWPHSTPPAWSWALPRGPALASGPPGRGRRSGCKGEWRAAGWLPSQRALTPQWKSTSSSSCRRVLKTRSRCFLARAVAQTKAPGRAREPRTSARPLRRHAVPPRTPMSSTPLWRARAPTSPQRALRGRGLGLCQSVRRRLRVRALRRSSPRGDDGLSASRGQRITTARAARQLCNLARRAHLAGPQGRQRLLARLPGLRSRRCVRRIAASRTPPNHLPLPGSPRRRRGRRSPRRGTVGRRGRSQRLLDAAAPD